MTESYLIRRIQFITRFATSKPIPSSTVQRLQHESFPLDCSEFCAGLSWGCNYWDTGPETITTRTNFLSLCAPVMLTKLGFSLIVGLLTLIHSYLVIYPNSPLICNVPHLYPFFLPIFMHTTYFAASSHNTSDLQSDSKLTAICKPQNPSCMFPCNPDASSWGSNHCPASSLRSLCCRPEGEKKKEKIQNWTRRRRWVEWNCFSLINSWEMGSNVFCDLGSIWSQLKLIFLHAGPGAWEVTTKLTMPIPAPGSMPLHQATHTTEAAQRSGDTTQAGMVALALSWKWVEILQVALWARRIWAQREQGRTWRRRGAQILVLTDDLAPGEGCSPCEHSCPAGGGGAEPPSQPAGSERY